MTDRIGLYPGTFDPITNGHLDVIQRAAKVMDGLVVGVAVNADKKPLFTVTAFPFPSIATFFPMEDLLEAGTKNAPLTDAFQY